MEELGKDMYYLTWSSVAAKTIFGFTTRAIVLPDNFASCQAERDSLTSFYFLHFLMDSLQEQSLLFPGLS